MTIRINDAARNTMADALVDTFDGGTLTVYSGAQPASAGDAASGTLLCTITLPTPAFGAAAAGVAAKAGTWTGTGAAADEAGWARLANTGDTIRVDYAVGQGSGDLSLDDTTVAVNSTVTVSTCTITMPAS